MANPVVNVQVNQSPAGSELRERLQEEVTANRIALNLRRRRDRLKQEILQRSDV